MNTKRTQKQKLGILAVLAIATLLLVSSVSALTIKNVEVYPNEVAPGQTAKISITLDNNLEDDLENINVALDFSSATVPLAPYQDSSETTIETLDSGDDEKVTFDVIVLPEAVSSVYKIPVKMSYNIVNENKTYEKTGTISIVVNSPSKIRVSVEGNLIKGMENEITVRVINDGLSDVKLASIHLEPVAGVSIQSSLYEYLGNIDSDDFDSIDVKAFVNENSASTILLPVTITYKDSTNKDFSQKETLLLKVYSQDEAKRIGLIKSPNYAVYIIILILVLVYIFYKVRKRMKKRKAQGA